MKFSQVRVIKGQFVPWEKKLVGVIGSFEKLRVREIGAEIIELRGGKSKGHKFGSRYQEVRETEGSGNRDSTVNWPAPNVWVFMAQLVEHCSANAEATGSNPVEAPKNFWP